MNVYFLVIIEYYDLWYWDCCLNMNCHSLLSFCVSVLLVILRLLCNRPFGHEVCMEINKKKYFIQFRCCTPVILFPKSPAPPRFKRPVMHLKQPYPSSGHWYEMLSVAQNGCVHACNDFFLFRFYRYSSCYCCFCICPAMQSLGGLEGKIEKITSLQMKMRSQFTGSGN
jgi:hypothetical protein